jgi:hypothetical protein
MVIVSVWLKSAKKMSVSVPSSVRWLTLMLVALTCVALFQRRKPSPG